MDVTHDGQRLATLTDGDHFGEIALLHDTPRTADAVAKTDCLCLVLARGPFDALLDENPDLRAKIAPVAAERLARNPSKIQVGPQPV